MADNNIEMTDSRRPKPLFAAASSLHTTSIISNETNDVRSHAKDAAGDNDLSSLTLDLKPSTLSAIIAAQTSYTQIHEQMRPEREYSNDRPQLEESLESEETVSRKRFSSDSESDVLMREPSPKRKKRSKEKHKKKKKHKHKEKSTPSSSDQSSSLNLPKIPKNVVFLEDIKDLKVNHAFHIDKTNDKDLWSYESVSKFHVAKYKPFIYNCCGAPHLSIRTDKRSKDKTQLTRYFKKEGLKHIRRKGLDFMTNIQNKPHSLNFDFIPFLKEDSEKGADMKVTGSYSCLDDATALYIQGKDAGYSKQAETKSDNFVMDEIFEKVRCFNQRTRDEPQNVQLWLEFVQFQDVVAQEDKSFKGQSISLRDVYQPSKSIIEKKLTVLEKAIEANPSSLELKIARLELYQDIWESDKLEKEWSDLLFVHSANVDLWQQYLSNQQSRLSKFSFSRVVKCYHKCFKMLVPILDGQVHAVNKMEDMEDKIIGLFTQYCSFLHQCGYTERAVSSYQALIEFSLFCPSSLTLSTSREKLKPFEEFWDSYVPRFGEPGSNGWRQGVEDQSSGHGSEVSVSTEEQEDAVILASLPRSQMWFKMEKIRQDAHWLPWLPDVSKGETEESCEDLDRLVLFDDISPAIFRLTKPESCVEIVCLFLKFLGFSSNTLEKKLEEISGKYSSGGLFDQYSISTLNQFPALSRLNCGVDVDQTWKPHECLINFIKRILIQAESYFTQSNRVFFTLLRLEFEVLKLGVRKVSEASKPDIKSIKKFGKYLLKESQNRNNLVVWDSYVRLLWACADQMEETVSIVDTALTMFMGKFTLKDLDKALGLCLLCRTYSQIILNFEPLEHIKSACRRSAPSISDKHQVMSCLGALVENKNFKSNDKLEISPAYVLKIRKRFQTILSKIYNKMELSPDPSLCDLIVVLSDCFALFEFCAAGFTSSFHIYASVREKVKNLLQDNKAKHHLLKVIQKYLYLSQLSFAMNVMYICFTPLAEIRPALNEALQEFPECHQFHATFLEIESGSHIAGRLRKHYERSMRRPETLAVPVFAVMSELTRYSAIIRGQDLADFQQTDSGTVHRIRSIFEHSLQSKVSSHCPLLWRLYLVFEAKFGSKKRARGIFYRALQSCPWTKCIYMDGIAVFGDSDLQEVMDLMTEGEIRVRMPLEEIDLLLTAEKEDRLDVDGATDNVT